MSNLVKFSQLKEIIESTWNKVKQREVTGATYNKDARTLTLAKTSGALEADFTDVASQSLANTFTEKNSFDKLYLGKRTEIVDTWGSTGASAAGGDKRFGRRDFTSTSNGNSGYVSSLLVALAGKQADQTATVSVWEVKKGTTRADDVPRQIIDRKTFVVKAVDDFSNTYLKADEYIEIPINKFYKEETYFIYEVFPSSDALVIQRAPLNENYIFLEDGRQVTTDNIRDQATKTVCGIHALIGGDVSINDILGNAGSGTVKSVNGANPDTNGNVQLTLAELTDVRDAINLKLDTSTAETTYVKNDNTTATGGSGNQGKVVKLDGNGKLDASMIPDLAITSVTTVANESDANNLVTNSTIHVGDMVIVTANQNKIYMYVHTGGQDFATRFVEIKMADGTVKSVNGQTSPDGNVVVKANHIQLSTSTETVEAELAKKIKTINSVEATDGNIDLSHEITGDNLLLKVKDTPFATIGLMTDTQKNEIIAVLNN